MLLDRLDNEPAQLSAQCAERHQSPKSYTSSSRSSSSSSPSSSSSSSSTSGSSFLGAVVRFGRADAGGDAPFSSSATSSRQLAIGRCASTSELSSSLMAANQQILASSQCFFTQFSARVQASVASLRRGEGDGSNQLTRRHCGSLLASK